MKLDHRVLRLIAIGASITANCQPCLQTNVTRALEAGADEQEIAQAIAVGKMVRQCAASNMDAFVPGLNQAIPLTAVPSSAECGCEQ